MKLKVEKRYKRLEDGVEIFTIFTVIGGDFSYNYFTYPLMGVNPNVKIGLTSIEHSIKIEWNDNIYRKYKKFKKEVRKIAKILENGIKNWRKEKFYSFLQKEGYSED